MLRERGNDRIESDLRANTPPEHRPRGVTPETRDAIYEMLGLKGLTDTDRKA